MNWDAFSRQNGNSLESYTQFRELEEMQLREAAAFALRKGGGFPHKVLTGLKPLPVTPGTVNVVYKNLMGFDMYAAYYNPTFSTSVESKLYTNPTTMPINYGHDRQLTITNFPNINTGWGFDSCFYVKGPRAERWLVGNTLPLVIDLPEFIGPGDDLHITAYEWGNAIVFNDTPYEITEYFPVDGLKSQRTFIKPGQHVDGAVWFGFKGNGYTKFVLPNGRYQIAAALLDMVYYETSGGGQHTSAPIDLGPHDVTDGVLEIRVDPFKDFIRHAIITKI